MGVINNHRKNWERIYLKSNQRKNNTQLNNWNFSGQNQKLFEELSEINDSVESILYQTFLQINQYHSSLLRQWADEGLKPKIDSYLLRYVCSNLRIISRKKVIHFLL